MYGVDRALLQTMNLDVLVISRTASECVSRHVHLRTRVPKDVEQTIVRVGS